MKKINKIGIVIFIVVLLLSNTFVFSASLDTVLKIVQASSEKKNLPDDQGFISKSIVASDLEKGEVTIELKLSNTAKETETTSNTEIFLVVDNSPSMDFLTTSGETRKNIVIEAAKGLVNSIYSNSTDVKVGIVDFNGANGLFGIASISNAKLITKLSDDKNTVIAGLQSIQDKKTVAGTNIDAGLQRAEQNFSSDCKNKVIVLLTDGIPNADVKGTESSNSVTETKALTVQANTKETLQKLEEKDIYVISMMTGLSADDGNTDASGNVFDKQNTIEEELAALENIFGTESNPTTGKFYNVKAANVSDIVNNDIFKDVMGKIQSSITEVVIKDFFPTDILENFTFEYVGQPSVGTVTEGIDETTKDITWNIDVLKGNQVATLKYKLKLKNMQNTGLLNKVISTNEKVVLDYKDSKDEGKNVILETSPKISLVEKAKVSTENNGKDNTVSPKELPKTGNALTIIIPCAILIAVAIFSHKKSKID